MINEELFNLFNSSYSKAELCRSLKIETKHKSGKAINAILNKIMEDNEFKIDISAEGFKERRLNREKEKWELEKPTCKCCGKLLPFERRNKEFCNSSCSATYNNSNRKENGYSSKNKKKKVNCLKCGNEIEVSIHSSKHTWICNDCKTKICPTCGKKFIPKKKNTIYCSNKCVYSNKDVKEKCRIAGLKSSTIQSENRRSKNEIYFYDLCKNIFKHVTNNENIFNGWDADVLIYDNKIAVLWNGNWHYIQIKRNSSLKQIQKRDEIKINEIKKLGWTPYVIEDRGKFNKKFVEQEFYKFTEYIKNNKLPI